MLAVMKEMPHARLWEAVRRRDPVADGAFVYGVRSTRIACRPSCPSRRPRPDRVEYFPDIAMALAAGYRPCRRCRPAATDNGRGDSAIARACGAIARQPDARWPLAQLAAVAGTSVSALRRAFRTMLGVSPRDYVAACRRRAFLGRLKDGESVTSATYAAGYGSASRVYDSRMGAIPPASYRRGGAGATIDWTTMVSPIGRILVAATVRGICFVAIGGSKEELARVVRTEFPRARVVQRRSAAVRPFLAAARAAAAGQSVPISLPADIVGTAFQWKVWRALTRIPRGGTVSYAQLAASIGRPDAVRAVARASATNPLALLVPCHRVIGKDGALRGYRWGVSVKQRLLRSEALGYHARRGLHAGIRGEVLG
jgi:AraC family transcriptional regulator of adaptative response/methylated-DNA-[protein]-cysteine methyltransferase